MLEVDHSGEAVSQDLKALKREPSDFAVPIEYSRSIKRLKTDVAYNKENESGKGTAIQLDQPQSRRSVSLAGQADTGSPSDFISVSTDIVSSCTLLTCSNSHFVH